MKSRNFGGPSPTKKSLKMSKISTAMSFFSKTSSGLNSTQSKTVTENCTNLSIKGVNIVEEPEDEESFSLTTRASFISKSVNGFRNRNGPKQQYVVDRGNSREEAKA